LVNEKAMVFEKKRGESIKKNKLVRKASLDTNLSAIKILFLKTITLHFKK